MGAWRVFGIAAASLVGVLVFGSLGLLFLGAGVCGCSPLPPSFDLGEPDVFAGRAYYPVLRIWPGDLESMEHARVDGVRVLLAVNASPVHDAALDFTTSLPADDEWSVWAKGARVGAGHLIDVGDRLDLPAEGRYAIMTYWDIAEFVGTTP